VLQADLQAQGTDPDEPIQFVNEKGSNNSLFHIKYFYNVPEEFRRFLEFIVLQKIALVNEST
jgi:hypothetical protein